MGVQEQKRWRETPPSSLQMGFYSRDALQLKECAGVQVPKRECCASHLCLFEPIPLRGQRTGLQHFTTTGADSAQALVTAELASTVPTALHRSPAAPYKKLHCEDLISIAVYNTLPEPFACPHCQNTLEDSSSHCLCYRIHWDKVITHSHRWDRETILK